MKLTIFLPLLAGLAGVLAREHRNCVCNVDGNYDYILSSAACEEYKEGTSFDEYS
ncbi:hypothetical protein E4U21_002202, partial [Claviceps maximensis]